jgi:hypothetical protein
MSLYESNVVYQSRVDKRKFYTIRSFRPIDNISRVPNYRFFTRFAALSYFIAAVFGVAFWAFIFL